MSVVLDESTLLHRGFVELEGRVIATGQSNTRLENIAEEVAIALEYNGIAHAVMMASPVDLEDFALGFSLSEGIVGRASDIKNIELGPAAQGITLQISIVESAFQRLKQRRRQLTGRTGCGLCGHESLETAIRPIQQITRDIQVSLAQVQAGLQQLQQQQILNQATGAVHAAALVYGEGVLVREDVGRHNALDKLIGAMSVRGQSDGFVIMTSRASYEVVHKAAAVNIPVLATISAPTDLAIRLAEEAGLTLIGFARDQRMTVYSHPRRVI